MLIQVSASGYKRFDEKDMKRLGFIRRAKPLGYTLDEIKQIIEKSRKGKSPCPMVRDLIQRCIQTHRHRNLMLAVMSGIVHGLRLNFLEYYNWSVSEEGYPFEAFSKKEKPNA